MASVAGPTIWIEPAEAAAVADVWTPLLELTAPASTFSMCAVITASALSGSAPAMGSIRLWNRSYDGFSQVRIYGTQTVVLEVPTVSAGDLIQIAAQPYYYAGEWEGSRVWVHRAEITLVDFADIPSTGGTYAPPLPPTQVSVAASGTSTALTYVWGEGWGPTPTSTAWRYRPVGGDEWAVYTASNHIPVTLPFDLTVTDFEVQAQQTTAGGTSAWGDTVVWTEDDLTEAPGGGSAGFGLTPFGTDFGN